MSTHEANLRAEARDALGLRRLAFAVHASAFPAGPIDLGVGAPASEAGRQLVAFVADLGFDTLQLGPDGQISDVNPSPYDGTAFARDTRGLDLSRLASSGDVGLLDPATLRALLDSPDASDPRRADPVRARRSVDRVLSAACQMWTRSPEHPAFASLRAFREAEAAWLERDVFFEVLGERTGHDDPTRFDPAARALLADSAHAATQRRSLRAVLGQDVTRAELGQWLAQSDAERLRAHAHACGMRVYADLQVGWSHRDRFLHAGAFHPRFRMGAPPSRTNPEGQPWGYPLLDPDQLDDAESPARALLRRRIRHTLRFRDGLRIDHPHGLVCPWVYLPDAHDPHRAVRAGTRAFESPEAEDADLRRWAIARPEQLRRDVPAFADDRVGTLEEGQVARWARLLDDVMGEVRAAGHGAHDVAAEVLSTCPAPLAQVLSRHGLGRFRVTQKARVDDLADVYRTDRARAEDWVMLGNHDTPPIFTAATRWLDDGSAADRAAYLAARLESDPGRREGAAKAMCTSPGALAQAHLADLLLGEARQVLVHFQDLFGETQPFNRPGVVHPDNWRARIAPDFETVYAERLVRGDALDLSAALASALRARGRRPDLATALEARSPRTAP